MFVVVISKCTFSVIVEQYGAKMKELCAFEWKQQIWRVDSL